MLNKFVSGQRPFGVSFLYAGWDKHYGFQLYQSDPSGNYGGWKAQAVGANNQVRFGSTLFSLHFFNDIYAFNDRLLGES